MVFFNYSTMQMAAKVVYYGPGLCGKTTNLQWIFEHTSTDSRGEMVSLATETDRTLFFDLLPIDVGSIAGFSTRIQLYTVPGQVFYNTTRKLVLKGVDGVVFVADSQRNLKQANIDSFKNLEENLAEMGLTLDTIPVVLQYNKRDLPNVSSVEEMNGYLNPHGWPALEASAIRGDGVFETLKTISKATLLALKKRLTKGKESGPSVSSAPRRPMAPKPAPPKKAPLAPKPAPAKSDQATGEPEAAAQVGAGTGPVAKVGASTGATPKVGASTGATPKVGAGTGPLPQADPVAEPSPAPEAAPATAAPAPVSEAPTPDPLSEAPVEFDPPQPVVPAASEPEAAAPQDAGDDGAVFEMETEVPEEVLLEEPEPAAVSAPVSPEPPVPFPDLSPGSESASSAEVSAAPEPKKMAPPPLAAVESAPQPTPAPPKKKKKKKSRSGGFDALAELEKLRKEAIRPKATAPSNGKREINRDVQFKLRRSDLQRAQRFSLRLQLEDAQQQVVDEVRHLHVDLDNAKSLEKLLLRLDIALDTSS